MKNADLFIVAGIAGLIIKENRQVRGFLVDLFEAIARHQPPLQLPQPPELQQPPEPSDPSIVELDEATDEEPQDTLILNGSELPKEHQTSVEQIIFDAVGHAVPFRK